MEAFKDEDGNITVDIENAEVIALTDTWTKAKGAKDLMALSDIVTDAHKLVRRLEKVKTVKAVAQDEAEEAKVAKGDKAKANSLNIPSPAKGGSGSMSWEQMQKIKTVGDASADDYFKAVAAS